MTLNEYASWATPMQNLERAAKSAGELLEDKKINAAVVELMTAQVAIAETIHHLMTRKR